MDDDLKFEPERSEMQDPSPPASEWMVAAVGLFLLVGSVAYLAYHAITGTADVPAPIVRVVAVDPQQGRYVVRLEVTNGARAPAARVRVEGVLTRNGQAVETSDTEFQYLPGGSTVHGGIFFTRNPRDFELQVAAKGFEDP